jgi:hypothetical protein
MDPDTIGLEPAGVADVVVGERFTVFIMQEVW